MPSLVDRLAINRLSFLRPSEKRRLETAVDGGLELQSLGFSELEGLVGRLFRSRAWRPNLALAEAGKDLIFLERSGVRFVSFDDPEFPPLLREIHEPPYGLFVRGAALRHERPSVAIVGTRGATGLGVGRATAFGLAAARAGFPVVSGLARGIDAAAHRGALAARNRDAGAAQTVAVLPLGIDAIYPPSHRGLASAILEKGGCLVSEYPPGEGARTWRFPERNRIIAGMARATLVVEAPEGSGALITADLALEAGRDVCVAADLLGGPASAGIDRLASDGAIALSSLDELLSEWGFSIRCEASSVPGREKRKPAGDEAVSASLVAALRAELGLEDE